MRLDAPPAESHSLGSGVTPVSPSLSGRLAASLSGAPVLAILRVTEPSAVPDVAHALLDGGIRVLEVPLTVPDALTHLRRTRRVAGHDAVVGVGTVRTGEQADAAVQAGADFLVTPMVCEPALTIAAQAGVPVFCGALSPTEIQRAVALGAAFIKVFPASSLGPGYLRDLRAPFPEVDLVPTGGVTVAQIPAYRCAGAAAVGMAGSLVAADAVQARAWKQISRNAAEALHQWRHGVATP